MNEYVTLVRQDRVVDAAFHLAAKWGSGHIIDGAPAIRHAVKVTRTLGRYCPAAPATVLAAALLHDAPELVSDHAEMEQRITAACGTEVRELIRLLWAEHDVLREPADQEAVAGHLRRLSEIPWLATLTIAEKIVAIEYVLALGDQATDHDQFWGRQKAFTRLLPYLRHLQQAVLPYIPPAMSEAYRQQLARCPHAA